MKTKNLIGERFGRLVVLSFEGKVRGSYRWACRCDCGKECVVQSGNLINGHTSSCGCRQRDIARLPKDYCRTHGLSRHRIRNIYNLMKHRCLNDQNVGYHLYGGRGISVCDRWAGSFQAFVDDMGLPPSDRHQLDRIDGDGDYAPENCRWATRKEQARNRRTNRVVEYAGESAPLIVWAERFEIPAQTLANRINSGWSVERALKMPVRVTTKSKTG